MTDETDVRAAAVLHVVAGPSDHGVTRHACALLEHPVAAHHEVHRIEVSARDGRDVAAQLAALPPATLTHLHLTDHLLAPTAGECAALVTDLARRRAVSLTLHDLPQRAEGDGRYARRRAAYAAMAGVAAGVVVASEHERSLLLGALDAEGVGAGGPVEVVPLPVDTTPRPQPANVAAAAKDTGALELGVFGFVYPGKGHLDAIEAAAAAGPHVGVVALGRASAGHEYLLQEYAARALAVHRSFRTTGYLPDDDLLATLRAVTVPVAPHRHVSASGSIATWLWAGRRPAVPSGPYTDELEHRCPGSLLRYGPAQPWRDLTEAVAAALAEPRLTWLDADVHLTPTGEQAAQHTVALLDAWAAAVGAAPTGTNVTTGARRATTGEPR